MCTYQVSVVKYYRLEAKCDAQTQNVIALVDPETRELSVFCDGFEREKVGLPVDSKTYPRLFFRDQHLYALFSMNQMDGFRLSFNSGERDDFLKIMHSVGCLLNTSVNRPFSQPSVICHTPPPQASIVRRDSTTVFNHNQRYSPYTSFPMSQLTTTLRNPSPLVPPTSCSQFQQFSEYGRYAEDGDKTRMSRVDYSLPATQPIKCCPEMVSIAIQTDNLVDLLSRDEEFLAKTLMLLMNHKEFIKRVAWTTEKLEDMNLDSDRLRNATTPDSGNHIMPPPITGINSEGE